MFRQALRGMIWGASVWLATGSLEADPVVDFEDLSPNLTYSGGGAYWNGSDGSGGFTSAGVRFDNAYNSSFGTWEGWSFSNTTDTATAGFTNQYSAFPGGGAEGSAQYGVYFKPFTLVPTVSPAAGGTWRLGGAYFTNTTYAALSMLNGDGFAKKFGGTSGNDPDWFKLTITGRDSSNQATGFVDFYLADYRFSNNSQDYVVDDWRWVDLTVLGEIARLEFDLTSSDVGTFGMNTPAFFAIDNFTVLPEPATPVLALMAGGLCLSRWRVRRRRPPEAWK